MKNNILLIVLLLVFLSCGKKETKEIKQINKSELTQTENKSLKFDKNTKVIVAYSSGFSQASNIKQQLKTNKSSQDIQKALVQAIKDVISAKDNKYSHQEIARANEQSLTLSITKSVKAFINNNSENKAAIVESLLDAINGGKDSNSKKVLEEAKIISNYISIYNNLPRLNLNSKEEKKEFITGMNDGVEGKKPAKSQEEIEKAQKIIADAGGDLQALLSSNKPEIKEAKIIMAYLSGYQISQLSQISDKEKKAFLEGAKDFLNDKEKRYSKEKEKETKKIILKSFSYKFITNIALQTRDKKDQTFAIIKEILSGKEVKEDSTIETTLAYTSFYKQIKEFSKNFTTKEKEAILRGFEDALAGKKSVYTDIETQASFTAYQRFLTEENKKEGEENKTVQLDFLEKNAKKDGIKTTKSGLQYEIIQKGTGKSPIATNEVEVHYEGKLIDGTIFDSSYKRKKTTSFPLNGVISGWTEGLQLMKEGAIYKFYIPYHLAYGEEGQGAIIPPYSTLIFKVELIKIVK